MAEKATIVIMVSVGNRSHLSDYTYPRLAKWAARHGYSCILSKKDNSSAERSPHFNKLIAHRDLRDFERYVIVDDDILISSEAPMLPDIPDGLIGLAKDAEQRNTEAPHIKWTANTGFIVIAKEELYLLEEAYRSGEYPFKCGDRSGMGIWGPHDQGIVNHILFDNEKIHQLNWRWNYQPILDYFINRGGGWEKWSTKRMVRLYYYATLLISFSANRRILRKAYCVHLIRGTHVSFFDKIVS